MKMKIRMMIITQRWTTGDDTFIYYIRMVTMTP